LIPVRREDRTARKVFNLLSQLPTEPAQKGALAYRTTQFSKSTGRQRALKILLCLAAAHLRSHASSRHLRLTEPTHSTKARQVLLHCRRLVNYFFASRYRQPQAYRSNASAQAFFATNLSRSPRILFKIRRSRWTPRCYILTSARTGSLQGKIRHDYASSLLSAA